MKYVIRQDAPNGRTYLWNPGLRNGTSKPECAFKFSDYSAACDFAVRLANEMAGPFRVVGRVKARSEPVSGC